MHTNSTKYLNGVLTIDNATTDEAAEIFDDPSSVATRRTESAKAMAEHPLHAAKLIGMTREGQPKFSGDKADAARQAYGRFWRAVDAKLSKLGAKGLIKIRAKRSDAGTAKPKTQAQAADEVAAMLGQWAKLDTAQQNKFLKLAGLKRA